MRRIIHGALIACITAACGGKVDSSGALGTASTGPADPGVGSAGAGACTSGGGTIGPGRSCATPSAFAQCGGVVYDVECTCPQGTCDCLVNGEVARSVATSSCSQELCFPTDAIEACGFSNVMP